MSTDQYGGSLPEEVAYAPYQVDDSVYSRVLMVQGSDGLISGSGAFFVFLGSVLPDSALNE